MPGLIRDSCRPDLRRNSAVPGRGSGDFRLSDLGGGLAPREVPAMADFAAPTALGDIPVDAACRRHILVAACAATYSWSAAVANSDAMHVYRSVCGVTRARIGGSPPSRAAG